MTIPQSTSKWWLALNGNAEGPYEEAQLASWIKTGRIGSQTQACPLGQREWHALADWPQLADLLPNSRPSPPSLYVGSVVASPGIATLLTNQQLSSMANAVCVFTLVVLPTYWLLGAVVTVSTMGSSRADVASFLHSLLFSGPVSLAIAILLFVAGRRLVNLQASALRLLTIGLWADIIFSVVDLLIGLTLGAVFDDGLDGNDPSVIFVVVWLMILALAFAAFVFEIVTLVWLGRHGASLPLDPER